MTRNTSSERIVSTCLSIVAIVLSYFIAASSSAVVDTRTNPAFSLEDNSIEPGELLQVQQPEVLLTPQSSTFHVIDECVKITLDEGVFHYKSRGGDQVCGLYLVADPSKSITITVNYLDVRCYDKGLISVVDGWELNGEVFPSLEDHEKPPQERFHDLCIDPSKQKHEMRRTFTSTQNAALIQYRIPAYGQGFSIHVHHVQNPRPCNILVQEVGALFQLENYGREINCSLTTLFDAKIRVISMSTGIHGSQVKYPASSSRSHSSGIYHKCGKMGLHDYVQIGGSLGLDTSKMLPIEEFCGYQHHPMSKYTTIFCGMTTIRLVSSGKHHNKVVAEVRRAEIEDIDSADFICGI